MNKKTRVKLLVSLSITLLLASLILLSVQSKTYQILELKALDLRFALKGNYISQAPILHIDIDDQSLSALGRWPWPRNYHAKVTEILNECGAKFVLMDIIFTEEYKDRPEDDNLFAEVLARTNISFLPFYAEESKSEVLPALKEILLKDISTTVESAAKQLGVDAPVLREKYVQAKKTIFNETMHDIIRKYPYISVEVLLEQIEAEKGWFLFSEDENYINERLPSLQLERYFINKFALAIPLGGWPFDKVNERVNVPIRIFTDAIRGSGYVNADPDIDGVTRKVPLFIRYENKILPQMTTAALIDLLQVKNIEAVPGRIIFKDASLKDGKKDISIPVDASGRMLVNWQGKWGVSFKHVPYYLIYQLYEVREQLNQELKSAQPMPATPTIKYLKKSEKELIEKLTGMVKNKICIIGLTATGTHDLRPIPLQENYPMVGTHANLIHTILSEDFIVKKAGVWSILIFFLTALVIAFGSLLKLWKSFLLYFGYVLAYFLIAYFVFAHLGWWIDLVGPMSIIVFGVLGITSFRFFTEEKEKLWIKQAFSHYLSKEVISELMNDPSRLKLGGERRNITVLFSDIRGFTTFSEGHQPEEVVTMLNEILSQQVKVIFKYSGTLDKFVGDEVMAFFGAPGNRHLNDHALIAVRTAIEIQAKMKKLQERWQEEKKEILFIGIGINTGDMVVGNMGSAERMDYTVIGDNVNLGARLCSAAGKDEIIISEATYLLVSEHVLAEKLEPIAVKGKAKPISIYRVIDLKEV